MTCSAGGYKSKDDAMELLPCPSRHVLENESVWFFCAHPRVHSLHSLVTAEMCHDCRFCGDQPEGFRPFPPPPGCRAPGFCRHLGEQTAMRECPSCGGSVKVKVFECRHPRHEETTLRECAQWWDYERRP